MTDISVSGQSQIFAPLRMAKQMIIAATMADSMITGISIDSRETKAGDLFVALPGTVSGSLKFWPPRNQPGHVPR